MKERAIVEMGARRCSLGCALAAAALVSCGGEVGTQDDGGADTGADSLSDTAVDSPVDTQPDSAPADAQDPDAAPDAEDAPEVPAGCPVPGDPGPGNHTISMTHAGMAREYLMHVPPSYSPSVRTPVVFNMHGLSSNANQEVMFSNMNPTADSRGFVAVYPQGYQNSWNAGVCCGGAMTDGIDDVGFILAVVDDVASRLCVDRDRVYASGMSNGGYMTYRLACEASHVFAGFAPVAGGLGVLGCAPARPVDLIAYHGLEDSVVAYSMGSSGFAQFATISGCTGDPVRTNHDDSYCDVYESCNGGVRVGLCTLSGMDHCWPGGAPPAIICETIFGDYSQDINANEHMWDFFTM